jgi:hypothetical protein
MTEMGDVRTYQGYYTSLEGVTTLRKCTYVATGIPTGPKPRGTEEDKTKALELLALGVSKQRIVRDTGLSLYMVRKLSLRK